MSESKELDWEEYEKITKYIYEMLGAQAGIKVRGYGRDNWIKGKSGVKHQVDVLTEQIDNQRRVLTAIECKFIKKKATKEIVMKLYAVMEDLNIQSGIIICKAGFTKDTIAYARHMGIKLVELWESGKTGLNSGHTVEFGELDIHINVAVTRPITTKIDPGSVILTDNNEIMSMHYAMMYTAEGRKVPFKICFKQFNDLLRDRDNLKEEITVTYGTPFDKLNWKYKGQEVIVEKITFTGYLTEFNEHSKKYFTLVDQVRMIMKEIFERKRITLSKTGMLYNLPPES